MEESASGAWQRFSARTGKPERGAERQERSTPGTDSCRRPRKNPPRTWKPWLNVSLFNGNICHAPADGQVVYLPGNRYCFGPAHQDHWSGAHVMLDVAVAARLLFWRRCTAFRRRPLTRLKLLGAFCEKTAAAFLDATMDRALNCRFVKKRIDDRPTGN